MELTNSFAQAFFVQAFFAQAFFKQSYLQPLPVARIPPC